MSIEGGITGMNGFGFVDPSFNDPFQGVTGGASGSVGTLAPGTGVRQKPNSGLYQIQVLDPNNRNRVIWVDAIYDPTRDRLIPIETKYRDPSDNAAMYKMFANQFVDSTDTGGIVPGTAPPPLPFQVNLGSGLVIGVAALLLVVYLATR